VPPTGDKEQSREPVEELAGLAKNVSDRLHLVVWKQAEADAVDVVDPAVQRRVVVRIHADQAVGQPFKRLANLFRRLIASLDTRLKASS
jgi:hypothetical protein